MRKLLEVTMIRDRRVWNRMQVYFTSTRAGQKGTTETIFVMISLLLLLLLSFFDYHLG